MNLKDDTGCTPLMTAVTNKQEAMMELLLTTEQEGDVKTQDFLCSIMRLLKQLAIQ
jgi:hypothetical protein